MSTSFVCQHSTCMHFPIACSLLMQISIICFFLQHRVTKPHHTAAWISQITLPFLNLHLLKQVLEKRLIYRTCRCQLIDMLCSVGFAPLWEPGINKHAIRGLIKSTIEVASTSWKEWHLIRLTTCHDKSPIWSCRRPHSANSCGLFVVGSAICLSTHASWWKLKHVFFQTNAPQQCGLALAEGSEQSFWQLLMHL